MLRDALNDNVTVSRNTVVTPNAALRNFVFLTPAEKKSMFSNSHSVFCTCFDFNNNNYNKTLKYLMFILLSICLHFDIFIWSKTCQSRKDL